MDKTTLHGYYMMAESKAQLPSSPLIWTPLVEVAKLGLCVKSGRSPRMGLETCKPEKSRTGKGRLILAFVETSLSNFHPFAVTRVQGWLKVQYFSCMGKTMECVFLSTSLNMRKNYGVRLSFNVTEHAQKLWSASFFQRHWTCAKTMECIFLPNVTAHMALFVLWFGVWFELFTSWIKPWNVTIGLESYWTELARTWCSLFCDAALVRCFTSRDLVLFLSS